MESAAALLAGVLAILVSLELPELWRLAAFSVPMVFVACYWRQLRWLLFLPLGLGWCWLVADQRLSTRLDPSFERQKVVLDGWVSSLPAIAASLRNSSSASEHWMAAPRRWPGSISAVSAHPGARGAG